MLGEELQIQPLWNVWDDTHKKFFDILFRGGISQHYNISIIDFWIYATDQGFHLFFKTPSEI